MKKNKHKIILKKDKNNFKKQFNCKIFIKRLLDDYVYISIMTIITIYALFFDDIRIIAFDKSTDDTFYTITTSCMAAFTLEIFLSSLVVNGYLNSFFFYLDIISTLSMVTDIGWFWDAVLD